MVRGLPVTLQTLRPFAALETSHDPSRIAIIDMGSNSWRLIVVDYVPGLHFKVMDEVQESVRVGEGMAEVNVLRPAAMDRAARVAQIYAAYCQSVGISEIVAVGTSAIRDAQNQKRFLQRVERESGLHVRVLSGAEEAYYGYLAAVNSTTLRDGFVVDMGGGSIQISRVQDRLCHETVSFPLGAVRLTERFLQGDPVGSKEVAALGEHVRAHLRSLGWYKRRGAMQLVGEGGNFRLIGRLLQKRLHYPLDVLHGMVVPLEAATSIRDELARASLAQRRRIAGMKPERADLSLAGAAAMVEIMRHADFDQLTICAQGLREGLFYEHFFQHRQHETPPMFADVRHANVLNLAHLYRFQEKHAHHIAHLTGEMFDQLQPEHAELGENERDILWAASILHDIGVAIDYHDHHKHSSYLVLNGGVPGYTHREIALIALLVRYHRKGRPTTDELAPLLGEGDEVRLVKLCALLRLAEQIDRSRDGVVHHVRLKRIGDRCIMELHSEGDEQVALWAVERHREIFESAFGVSLEILPVPIEE
jgi:exopolyphosphatase/guanosine-5'-triphosphate,3'-diphosphate pyrophosphatase